MKTAPAIAILPYSERLQQGLGNVNLDNLHWPLGRPERLLSGSVSDMLPTDHLVSYPKTKLYFARRLSVNLSLMIVEPDVIHKKHLILSRFFQARFHQILTKNRDLIKRCRKARFFYYGASQIKHPDSVDCTKTDMCSLIASARNQLPGHQLRHQVVAEMRKSGLDVVILGRGYRPFGPKEEGLAPFRYSIVIENSSELSYFTEKIVDACLCRSVPIYWGAPDIGDYFDLNGLIVCHSLEEINEAVRRMSVEGYKARRDAIERNFKFAMQYADVEDRVARVIMETSKG